jgi:hypothetical protein
MKAMKAPIRAGRPAAVAAAALLAAGLTAGFAPASPGIDPALDVSPSSGSLGAPVTVTARCEPDTGVAVSDAFQASVPLTESAAGVWTGTGQVRSGGLDAGRAYAVIVKCLDGTTLSTNFTLSTVAAAGAPPMPAGAGNGSPPAGMGGGDDAQATALCVGGGLTIAAAVGYGYLARRRREAGRHSY